MRFAAESGNTELAKELCTKVPELDIQNCMALLRSAAQAKDVGRSLGVLAKLTSSGVVPDIAAYNCVLDCCATCGDISTARTLMNTMRELDLKFDIITYNTVLKGFTMHGDEQGAWQFLKEMEAAGFPPNDISYNSMLNMVVSSGKIREAWGVVDLMERRGVRIDQYTISTMMKAVKRSTSNRDVARVLEMLDRSGCELCEDEVLLNTVLETCVRHREYARLRKILRRFRDSQLSSKAAVHTYGTLIRSYSALGDLASCHDLWERLILRSSCPSDVVLGCMMNALVSNDSTDSAANLMREWKLRVKPNAVMYSTLIKGYALARQTDKALALVEDMRRDGVEVTTCMYNAIIDAHSRRGSMDEILHLLQRMTEDGCVPDDFTHSLIVKGYCVKGDLKHAVSVFSNMKKTGSEGDTVVFNTILDGCIRHNDTELADKLLSNIDTYNIVPSSFTLGTIVKMWGRRRNVPKAFEAVETFPVKYGFHLNTPVQTCLMSACLLSDDGDRALDVFEAIRRQGKGADSKAYDSLVSGLTRLGRFAEAVRLVEEAYRLTPEAKNLDLGMFGGQTMQPGVLDDLLRALAKTSTASPNLQSGAGGPSLWETLGARLLVKLRSNGESVRLLLPALHVKRHGLDSSRKCASK
jgi:pentatricopeptide repeat protein